MSRGSSDIHARRDYSLQTDNQNGPPVWLISFTDVIALMLTFFVLMFAMSEPDYARYEQKIGLTSDDTAQFNGADNEAGQDEGVNISRLDFNLAEDLQYVEALFIQIIQERGMGDRIKLEGNGDLLMVYLHPTLQSSNRDFLMFLNYMDPVFDGLGNRLEIIGDPEAMGIFDDLQTLGRILKNYGYDEPLSISVRDLSKSSMQSRMAIGVRSNDGRRIVDD